LPAKRSIIPRNLGFFNPVCPFASVRNDLFLFLLIVVLRLADGVTSYLPARGRIPGLAEGNPIALLAIERWGFYQAFAIMLLASIGFTVAFLVATYLEEVRSTSRVDYESARRIRTFRLAGMICLAAISAAPLLNNLAVAIGL